MEFEEMIRLSLEIERRFDEINERRWEVQTITVELSKQVGDLCKVILNHEGYYLPDRKKREDYKARKEDIANELADILHQIIRIANYYDIDLQQAHIEARKKEGEYIEKHKRGKG